MSVDSAKREVCLREGHEWWREPDRAAWTCQRCSMTVGEEMLVGNLRLLPVQEALLERFFFTNRSFAATRARRVLFWIQSAEAMLTLSKVYKWQQTDLTPGATDS